MPEETWRAVMPLWSSVGRWRYRSAARSPGGSSTTRSATSTRCRSPATTSPRPGRTRSASSPSRWPTAVYEQLDADSVHAQFDHVLAALTDKLPRVAEHLEAARPNLSPVRAAVPVADGEHLGVTRQRAVRGAPRCARVDRWPLRTPSPEVWQAVRPAPRRPRSSSGTGSARGDPVQQQPENVSPTCSRVIVR